MNSRWIDIDNNHGNAYRGYLSLELFIANYHSQNALEVAQRGLATMQTAYTIEG